MIEIDTKWIPDTLRLFGDWVSNAWRRIRPPKEVFIVPFTQGANTPNFRWHSASIADSPAMQIHGSYHITNMGENAIQIVDTYIARHTRRTQSASAMTVNKKNIAGPFLVEPGHKTKLLCDYFIAPPFRKPGQAFKARIVFIDHRGKRHKTKPVVFYHRASQP